MLDVLDKDGMWIPNINRILRFKFGFNQQQHFRGVVQLQKQLWLVCLPTRCHYSMETADVYLFEVLVVHLLTMLCMRTTFKYFSAQWSFMQPTWSTEIHSKKGRKRAGLFWTITCQSLKNAFGSTNTDLADQLRTSYLITFYHTSMWRGLTVKKHNTD